LSTELLLEIVVVAFCLAAGGVLKGAIGAGAPLFAVPALATFFDVRFAVVVMLVPNLLTNSWQAFQFRRHLPDRRFLLPFIGGGMAGVIVGTFMLKALPPSILAATCAGAVLGYVVLRLARPDWHLPMRQARWFALPAGLVAGILQGTSGISAPVSITFLNAMQIGRDAFIAGISSFFATFGVVHIITASASSVIQPGELFYSLFAVLPITAAMPLGNWLATRVSAVILDRVILVVLTGIAVQLTYAAFF
jgi:uncharacterized membrane protein YfcA